MTKSIHSKSFLSLFPILVISILFSCASSQFDRAAFVNKINQGHSPWSHERFDASPGKFSFAVISDLYGGERPGVINVALEQINLLRPEFIMSVGDLIDGGTEDKDQINKEWNEFDHKAAVAKAPVFYAGGNHDLTNVAMREVWHDRYGPRYYHFVYKNVLFLVLDSEDYIEERMQEIYEARAIAMEIMDGKREGNAATAEYFKMPERRTGEVSSTQSAYFEKVIQETPHVRWTFLFMHKPVWMGEEPGNLDHIEAALAGRPYTVINGHFHTYSHITRKDRDYIMLGTTGGSQNDKSDMAFDHFTMVTMTDEGPSIANLKLEGVLNKQGEIPADGSHLCFQASKCKE